MESKSRCLFLPYLSLASFIALSIIFFSYWLSLSYAPSVDSSSNRALSSNSKPLILHSNWCSALFAWSSEPVASVTSTQTTAAVIGLLWNQRPSPRMMEKSLLSFLSFYSAFILSYLLSLSFSIFCIENLHKRQIHNYFYYYLSYLETYCYNNFNIYFIFNTFLFYLIKFVIS